jgi:signal transduction histidine kinase
MLAEAVANAVKHGKADRMTINFERSPHTLNVNIDDNGKGFSGLSGTYENELLSTMEKRPRSIYERVQELGGRMTLFTSPKGSRLQIQLPLN